MNEQPKAQLELDPLQIARVIDVAVVASSEVVAFHFNALASADLSQQPEMPDSRFRLRGPAFNKDQRRLLHQNWILAKAFQELLHAVRHGLEIAHVITTLVSTVHRTKSSITVADFLRPFEKKAANLKFPRLLDDVNKKLATKLDFADAYESLQSARNCLEHRAGIIGEPETRGKGRFELSIPRMKVFYMRNGAEVEIGPGSIVEPDAGKDEAEILMKIEARKRSLGLGERLNFTLSDFSEIAFACHHLGQQLTNKMPRLPI